MDEERNESTVLEDGENAAEQEGMNNTGSDNNSSNENVGSKEKTLFTQSQVSRMMTKEKRQGAASVYRELGIDPKDSKAVAMIKALVASQKSEEQKAVEKQAEDNAKEQEAEIRVVKAEVKAESMVMGIKREFVEDMVVLVMSKLTDDSDIKTLIGEYKKKYPSWFNDGSSGDGGENNSEKKKVGHRGTGSSIKGDNGGKKGDKAGEGNQSMGQRLAARRRAMAPKKSFWS